MNKETDRGNLSPAQRLVGFWIDEVREATGYPPPVPLVPRMGREVKALLATHPPELIEGALRLAAERGKPPHVLPHLLLEHSSSRRRGLALEYVQEHGWPTGVRQVRGTHGSAQIADTLGHDKPSGGTFYPRPTLGQIANALDFSEDRQGAAASGGREGEAEGAVRQLD